MSVSSFRLPSRASLAACLALALLAVTGEARAEAGGASVPAAGHIVWAQVAVRTKPSRTAPRATVLRQFRDDFRPRVVLALAVSRDAKGEPAWYRISLPGRPNGRTAPLSTRGAASPGK